MQQFVSERTGLPRLWAHVPLPPGARLCTLVRTSLGGTLELSGRSGTGGSDRLAASTVSEQLPSNPDSVRASPKNDGAVTCAPVA